MPDIYVDRAPGEIGAATSLPHDHQRPNQEGTWIDTTVATVGFENMKWF